MKQMSKQLVVTEKLKSKNQMEWVGKMNNIKSAAEESVLKNYIYNVRAEKGYSKEEKSSGMEFIEIVKEKIYTIKVTHGGDRHYE